VNIHVYVEGPSDRDALDSLMANYVQACHKTSWEVRFIKLGTKHDVLARGPAMAWANLESASADHVIAMPDLHPLTGFAPEYAHDSYQGLQALLGSLLERHAKAEGQARLPRDIARRFHAFALCHDLEMLLLAAREELERHLGLARGALRGRYTSPAEDQDDREYPKKVVQQLFRQHKGRAYDDVDDAPAILATASPVALRLSGECPRFSEFLTALESITGVPLS